MRKIISIIKNVPAEANFILFFSVFALILKVFIFNEIAAPHIYFHIFGNLFESMLISIIASYIFYFFVINIKEHRDKDNVKKFIKINSEKVVSDFKSILSKIKTISGVMIDDKKLEFSSIENAFLKISPNSLISYNVIKNGMIKQAEIEFIHFLNVSKSKTKKSISNLVLCSNIVEKDLFSILTDIDSCLYFCCIDTQGISLKNENFLPWADEFYNYCLLCKNLDEYIKKNLC